MKTILFIAVSLVASATTVIAQSSVVETRIGSVGAYAGGGLSLHSAAFSSLPGVPSCCPEYTGGSGSGLLFGIDGALPLSSSLDLSIRVGYQSSSVTMESGESVTIRQGNGTGTATFNHTLETVVSSFVLEPAVEWRFGSLVLLGGLRFGLASSGTFDQQERLSGTNEYTYTDGRLVNNARSGALSDVAGVTLGAVLGLRYHVHVSQTLDLMPEVAFAPTFTDNIANTTWTTSMLRAGIGIRYVIFSRQRETSPLTPR
ncbi:MAG: hypothetical protein MUC47_01705 [Candidatus Kapabacteria bacterium]|jgi:hypothetical protein|nr:hypothetical protein [Candidatus Kapabacteria bacterium]